MALFRNNKQKVTPEKAIQILKAHGTDISQEEAEIILDFMYKFAKLSVNQQLSNSADALDLNSNK